MRSKPSVLRLLGYLSFHMTLLCLISSSPYAAEFTGTVVGVMDGDTIEVVTDRYRQRIRLTGIDCPEKGQPFGKKAKQAASAIAFGKHVTIHSNGMDKYRRVIGEVVLSDGRKLSHELVKGGWCWWYRKYAPEDTELENFEQKAREAKIGLWSDQTPIPPWIYRKTRQGKGKDLSSLDP